MGRIRDWIAFLDHGTPAEQRDRTQVNHHAYRLRFSECHTQSDGALTCTTCHDPHRKVAAAERAGFYRSKCLQCHQLTDCAQEDMGHGTDPATADCATCHMVRTRPADVVHATVTDHFIRRRHPDPDPAAPREERPDRPAPSTVTPYFDDTSGSAMWRVLAGLATLDGFEVDSPGNSGFEVMGGALLGSNLEVADADTSALLVMGGTATIDGMVSNYTGLSGLTISDGVTHIHNSSIGGSVAAGVSLSGGDLTITGGSVSNSGLAGIEASAGVLTVTDTTIHTNSGDGVLLSGSVIASVSGLALNDNGGYGLSCDGDVADPSSSSVQLLACSSSSTNNLSGDFSQVNGCELDLACTLTTP